MNVLTKAWREVHLFPFQAEGPVSQAGLVACIALGLLWFAGMRWRTRWKKREYSVRGKHICVTGGSEGIGLAVAAECIRRGAQIITVVARDRRKLRTALEKLAELTSELQQDSAIKGGLKKHHTSWVLNRSEKLYPQTSVLIQALSCDVSDAEAVQRMFSVIQCPESCVRKGEDCLVVARQQVDLIQDKAPPLQARKVDVLVTCAGLCVCDTFERLQSVDLERQLRVNVLGSLYPAQQLYKEAREELQSEAGASHVGAKLSALSLAPRVVVLVASMAAQTAIFGFVGYGASKFAIRGAWEAMAMEGRPLKIRVLCAFPPNTDTPGFAIENHTKPAATKAIEDAGGLWTADAVAEAIVQAIENGSYRVTFGLSGRALAALTAGFGPVCGFTEAIWDAVYYCIAKPLSFYLMTQWNGVVYQYALQKL